MSLFDIPRPSVAIAASEAHFPVRRIYCVGRNYAAHAREMGADPDREPPFFFMKPADALLESGSALAYPPRTRDLQHEIELVVAIGAGGRDIPVADVTQHIFGYAAGIDFTRRDLQAEAKKLGRPWETSKSFDGSAAIAALRRAADIGHPAAGRIWLSVNGSLRQEGNLSELIWSVPEAIAELSTLFTLAPGDLVYTGTPAGVGTLARGDRVTGGIDEVGEIAIEIQ